MKIYFVGFEGCSPGIGLMHGNCKVEVPEGKKFTINKVQEQLKKETESPHIVITFYKLMTDEEVFE